MAWGLAAVLALVVVVGGTVLCVRLRLYWVAKYRGQGADLRRAVLPDAPLAGADLSGADLTNANLRHADLEGADLSEAKLAGADLTGANLDFARLWQADLTGADLTGAKLDALLMDVDLTSARGLARAKLHHAVDYADNHWPKGFDPQQHGVLLIERRIEPRRKLLPVDEATKDRSFLAFRNKLMAAVKKHDRRYLHSILDPHVISSFGDEETIAAFKRTWESKDDEPVMWKELLTVLSLGGQFVGKGEFCAPYVYTRFPTDVDDPEYLAVISKNVPVRIRPSASARVVEMLSYNIVKSDPEGAGPPDSTPPGWAKVTTPKGRKGYVSDQSVRSPIDVRACFVKRRGRWWLKALVSGD